MDTPEFLTLPEVAGLLRIGERTAYDRACTDLDAWIARGGEAQPEREST